MLAERSPLSSSKDGGRHRAFRKHLRSPGERGRAPQQQLCCQPRRRTPVTIYRGWWAGLHPSGSESTSPLSTPPKSKLAWLSERAPLGDRQGHPFHIQRSPSTGRLDPEAALSSSSTSNDPTSVLQTRSSRGQENTEAAHLGLATAPPRDSKVWVKRGIKKKKAGKRQKICRKFPRLSKGTSILVPSRSRETAASFYIF